MLHGLGSDTYELTIGAGHYETAVIPETVSAGQGQTPRLRPRSSDDRGHGPGGSAAGPLSEITVAAIDTFGDVVAQATTGQDGTYTLSTLPPGTFSLLTSGGYGTALEDVTTAEHQQLTLPDIVLMPWRFRTRRSRPPPMPAGHRRPYRSSSCRLTPRPTRDIPTPRRRSTTSSPTCALPWRPCRWTSSPKPSWACSAISGRNSANRFRKSFDAVKADYAKLVLAYIPLIKQVNAVVSEIQTLAQKTQTMLKDVQDHDGKFLRTRIPPDSYSTPACPPLPIPDPAQIIRDADNVLKNLGSTNNLGAAATAVQSLLTEARCLSTPLRSSTPARH